MIHLLIGSTGAGKTHYAKTLAAERRAVRFAIDDWMKRLFFPDLQGEISFAWAMERINRCEELIWSTAEDVLQRDLEVILEISMSTRELRFKQYERARSSGFPHKVHYLDIDRETRLQRVLARNKQKDDCYAFDVTPGMFEFVEGMFETPGEDELVDAIVIRG